MICIVNKENNVIVKCYDSHIPILNISKGLYLDSNQWDHLVAPEGLSSSEVMVQDTEGVLSIVADMDAIKAAKLESIRKQRNELLKKTDSKWIECCTKGVGQVDVETDKVTLRDLMTSVQSDITAMTELQDIRDYDPISSLTLLVDYSQE